MSATLSSIQTTGYHIIDSDIELTDSIKIGDGSTLHFCGGKIVNNSASVEKLLKGDNITIIAGPAQIFQGKIKFANGDGTKEAQWTMERAYPQWFGAKSCSHLLERNTISTYDIYPDKVYAFDLSSTGDALRFSGNHVSTYCEKIDALKIRSCNGGSITGNIFNSDVLIVNSRGIDFAANHMEYGSNLTIATSAVSVRDNYIWRGTRPAITLRRSLGDAYNLSHWSAELSNNQLFWRDQHTVGAPQAAQSVYPYDIRTDGYGTLDIHNTFHTISRLGPAEGSNMDVPATMRCRKSQMLIRCKSTAFGLRATSSARWLMALW